MPGTWLTENQRQSIERTHRALVPAYIMHDDGRVVRFWPGGLVERMIPRQGRLVCRATADENPARWRVNTHGPGKAGATGEPA